MATDHMVGTNLTFKFSKDGKKGIVEFDILDESPLSASGKMHMLCSTAGGFVPLGVAHPNGKPLSGNIQVGFSARKPK